VKLSVRSKQVTREQVLTAISDQISQDLLATIATNGLGDTHLADRLNMTRKQFYSRISRLTGAQLVERRRGNYRLTAFGNVIYHVKLRLDETLENKFRYMAIDAMDSYNGMPKEERAKVIESLINDYETKDILVRFDNILCRQSN
jgi:predicted transcriptional regulator